MNISADFRSVFDWGPDIPELTERELRAAATMHNAAVAAGIIPRFEDIWTAEQLATIAQVGQFTLPKDKTIKARLRRIIAGAIGEENLSKTLARMRR